MTHRLALLPLTLALLTATAHAADWPANRFDARRSSASPQELPARLHLQWVREYAPLEPAWPDQGKMQFDTAYDPIVLGRTLIVGSPREDWVAALDTATGKQHWRFFTDGPVRFAPFAWEGRVYVASDDGHLYCLDADSGRLLWKFRGAPAERRVLGNRRLISAWPARGAPVIAADGTLYFAASIWPFMGTFIHALDARTGKVVWTNSGDGSTFMKQPHNADAFAGVAPQGALVVQGDHLLIPGGRSIPALYDRKTGKMLRYQLAENSKRGGGSDAAGTGSVFFNGGAAFDLLTEKYLGDVGKLIAFTDEVVYTCPGSKCQVFDLKNASVREVKALDRKGKPTTVKKWTMDALGSCGVPKDPQALIKAGGRLYVGGPGFVQALEAPTEADQDPVVPWRAEVEGTVSRLLAADDRLFAVTREGRILCFGGEKGQATTWKREPAPAAPADGWTLRAEAILKAAGVRAGYGVVWGAGSGRLVTELARQSSLHLIVVEPDADKVQKLREQLVAAGLYGERVSVHAGDPLAFALPPYLASVMASESLEQAGVEPQASFLKKAFESLRPYGGVACLPLPADQQQDFARAVTAADLAGAKVRFTPGLALLVRAGALPGSANWTGEHADAANTRVSQDRLVKAPLGLLWFGGPSHEGILPRHGHGPQPQVFDGRLFIEGIDMMRAMDIYTGRILWEAPLPGVGAFYNNTAHQPGANSSGTNFIATAEGVYVVHGKKCLLLDLDTGRQTAEFQLPLMPGMTERPRWGCINVAGNYLVGGADPLFDPKLSKPPESPKSDDDKKDEDKKPDEPKSPDKTGLPGLIAKVSRGMNDNLSSSKHLVVMDRQTGEVLWTASARLGWRHNAVCIGGGRLYAIDRLSGPQLDRLKRRGEKPPFATRLVAFDLGTGKELWSSEDEVFGTWLSYSEARDVLVESGRNAGDTIMDEPRGMRAYRGGDGKTLWFKTTYLGPAMIHGDTILMAGRGCSLLTGEPAMRRDPITGEVVEWSWSRTYGCNTPAASQNLLTFRSGAAGYFDLCGDGGTGNLGGFRSSCTNNLIVAGGVLTAPDYTRTCTCSYQNQTSVGLVHMPEAEMWTFFGASKSREPVRRLGLNLGAPGDRRAADGTLWLEYPNVGGASPAVAVKVTPAQPEWFRKHAALVEGPLDWVAASGAKGLTSLTITLSGADDEDVKECRYTVRLHFAEPDDVKAGQRVFDVALQGQGVLKDFDVAAAAGAANRGIVKEFKGVRAGKELVLTLTPAANAALPQPVLCGVEVVAEER
jgi:outer membrane protein assembly factor BamB